MEMKIEKGQCFGTRVRDLQRGPGNTESKKISLRESLYFSQDTRSGKFLHLTRPHQFLPDRSVLV